MSVVTIRSERRLVIVMACFLIAFVVMTLRLVQLQVFERPKIAGKVEKSRLVKRLVPARRGDIFDRRGRPLAESVNRYDVTVLPSVFRERNRVDILLDVALAWFPHLAPPVSTSTTRAGRVESRRQRHEAAFAARHDIIRALLAASPDDIVLDKVFLRDRLAAAVHPSNELVLPPSRLPRHMLDALVLLADDPAVATRKEVVERLEEASTVGAALGVDVAECVARVEREHADLLDLAARLFPESPGDFWHKLFAREQQDLDRLERRIEADVDDQIALEHLGKFDFAKLDEEDLRQLAIELKVPDTSTKNLEAALAALAARVEDDDDAEAATALEVADAVLAARPVERLEPWERLALARHLQLWVDGGAVLKRAFADRIRAEEGYTREDYLTFEKAWARRVQYKAMVPYDLRRSATFDVARDIWSPFGLRRLGFGVRAGWGRVYWRDEDGVASLLLGRVNRSGNALGGLELELARKREGLPTIVGTKGVEVRRLELNGGLTPLPSENTPQPGADVTLTLDRDLQARVEEILVEMIDSQPAARGLAKGGAACVIDIESGDVLALATVPRVSGDEYLARYLEVDARRRKKAAVRRARDEGLIAKVELDRMLQGLGSDAFAASLVDKATSAGFHAYHPPGSVMKPFASVGFLSQGVFTPGETVNCPKRGIVDAWSALARSSNEYFWEGGRRSGLDFVVGWFEAFGLYRPIRFLDGPARCQVRRKRLEGDRVKNVVIGQGNVTTAPLEVAAMMANLARRGRVVTPRIVRKVGDLELEVERGTDVGVSPALYDRYIFEPMAEVAAKHAGRKAREVGLVGKTGTAELKGDGVYGDLHNAWFAGFAPVSRPRFAVAVLWERNTLMGKSAAPWAVRIVEAAEELIE